MACSLLVADQLLSVQLASMQHNTLLPEGAPRQRARRSHRARPAARQVQAAAFSAMLHLDAYEFRPAGWPVII